ncbi:MAG: cytochrome c oxidase subunit II [Halobacteria archaeon]|nr:cytochrome c oxidase subunit II [Halobacteria archaeon]
MDYRRTLVRLVSVVSLATVFVGTVAASHSDTATEEIIQGLNSQFLVIGVPLAILVEVILIYTVWRFRNNDDPKPTKENRRLEITWTVATAVILIFVGVSSFIGMAQMGDMPNQQKEMSDPVVVEVTGVQWFWKFNYPGENVSTQGTMVIPANESVRIEVTSSDVIHSYAVPELGWKTDAIPGQTNVINEPGGVRTKGEYQLYCTEFCGTGHSKMLGTVKVVSQQEYQNWLEENRE